MLSNDLKAKEDQIENLKMTGLYFVSLLCVLLRTTSCQLVNCLYSLIVVHLESDLQSSHDKLRQLASSNDGKIEKYVYDIRARCNNGLEPLRVEVDMLVELYASSVFRGQL